MAKNGFKVIDAEPHMMEPLEMWIERLPEPFRSRTHVVRPENGGYLEGSSGRIVLDGVETPKSTPNPMVRRRSQRRVTANPGLMKVTRDPSPDVFLEGFDIEGIDVGVFMPTVAMGMVRYDDLDPEHALALCMVYNDFTAEFCSAHPDRFKFWAWVPPHDATLAAGEARRAVEELGAVAVAMTGGAVNGNLLSDEHFDPLWEEMDRLGTAFGMHGPPANYLLRDNYNHRYWGKAEHGGGRERDGRAGARHDAAGGADHRRGAGALPEPQTGLHGGQRELAAVVPVEAGRQVGDPRTGHGLRALHASERVLSSGRATV